MKYLIVAAIAFSLVACSSNGQKNEQVTDNQFTIVAYNVENLFDTIHDQNKFDEEFMPTSKKKWNTERYHAKLKKLASVIVAINKQELPELVGLIEVENRAVLQDLAAERLLLDTDYQIVHEESPDARGIDVALLYRPDEFEYIDHKKLTVTLDSVPNFKTRDILYVRGVASGSDTLHVFVNHWSSRRGGEAKSEHKRIRSAEVLKVQTDKILTQNPNAKIVIMGDMNDEPNNKSVHETLFATNNQKSDNPLELYNLLFDKDVNGKGTYNYRGNWNMIDNMIVSQALLKDDSGYEISTDGAQIFSERFIMFENTKTGDLTPSRTYGGPNYYGGYSDHLPIYLILKKTK